MKVDATIQARLGSSRLPGKVLKPILGRPMLELQIERIRQSRRINRVIVATTQLAEDDAIADLTRRLGCECFRGSEEDVLGRVAGALVAFDVELHVEFQGDNPMPDAALVDSFVDYFVDGSDKYDYVTNSLKTTYPPGAEVSVYPARVLIDAERNAGPDALREHVGMHIYQHPERYRVKNIEAPAALSRPGLHLEVDTAEDFELVSAVFEELYPKNSAFSLSDVIEFTDRNPRLAEGTRATERRWKRFRNDD